MKVTDDYRAKYRLWAENPRVAPAPAPVKIPHFKSRRFSSHAEMNAWKQSVLRQLAQATGPNEWTFPKVSRGRRPLSLDRKPGHTFGGYAAVIDGLGPLHSTT